MKPNVGKQVRLLIICVIIIAASSLIAFGVERDFGKVDIQTVRFAHPLGVPMAAKLYRPVAATEKNKLPGVLAIHGYNNDKETQDAFSIELARRGFVVLAMDMISHGDSGTLLRPGAPSDATYGGDAAYKYLKSLAFVDPNNLGIMGHSMGAMAAVAVATANPDHKAVNPQCGTPGAPALKNLLLTQARWEEFKGFRSNLPRTEGLTTEAARLKALGLTVAEWDTTYGDFGKGTARRQAYIPTVHPGVTHHSKAVTEASDWMRQSLYAGGNDPYWIPANQQIYMWKELMTLLALLVAALSIIPLCNILLALPFFAPVAQPMPSGHVITGKSWLVFALINTAIAGITYPYLTGGGAGGGVSLLRAEINKILPSWLVLPMANGVLVWFLGNVIICAILFTIWYRTAGKKAGVTMYDLGASFDRVKTRLDWGILGKTALLASMLFAWMYALEGFSQSILGIEFRFMWPFMRQFSMLRFGLFWEYLIPALLFFLVNGGLFLFGQARQKEYSTPWKTQLFWWLKNCFAALFGLLVVWCVQYVPYIFLGMAPGFEGLNMAQYSQMWPLMLFVFIPEFAFLLFLLTWFYRRTGRIYLGALMVASMAVWFSAAGSVITKVR